MWTSTADSKFFVVKDPRGNTLGRGTRVTLHLKDDAAEFLEEERIKNLVKKYSEFINYPISLYCSKTVTEEVPVEISSQEEPEVVDLDGTDDLKIQTEDEKEPQEPQFKTV